MVEPLSWLTGAAQGQQCASCGDLVPVSTSVVPDAMIEHLRWWCAGPAKPGGLTKVEP